jgi:hypothetical protein
MAFFVFGEITFTNEALGLRVAPELIALCELVALCELIALRASAGAAARQTESLTDAMRVNGFRTRRVYNVLAAHVSEDHRMQPC